MKTLTSLFLLSIVVLSKNNFTYAQTLASGESHTILICDDGTTYGFGYNGSGQLGNGSDTNSNVPLGVEGSDFISVEAGGFSTVAVKSDGSVWCWGDAHGDGTDSDRYTPVRVLGIDEIGYLTGITQCSVGTDHILLLMPDGTVTSWGYNWSGEIGNGDSPGFSYYYPDYVLNSDESGNLESIAYVSASFAVSFAITTDNQLLGWGRNSFGQFGDGTTNDSNLPVPLPAWGPINKIKSMSVGSALALRSDGTLLASGYNGNGQLGDGTKINRTTPVSVLGLTDVIDIDCGQSFSVALKTDGTVWTWGHNFFGELGDGTTDDNPIPAMVTGLPFIVAITAGDNFVIAKSSDGSFYSWGEGHFGQLGDGTNFSRWEPEEITWDCSASDVDDMEETFGSIFPNPSNGTINLIDCQKATSIELFDFSGKRVSVIPITANSARINLGEMHSGVYLVRIISGNEILKCEKLVIAKSN